MTGFIQIPREFIKHAYWKQDRIFSKAEAEIDIYANARYGEGSEMVLCGEVHIEVKRGEWAASYRFLAKRWKWSPNKVSLLLKNLQKENKIETLKRTGQTVIKVLNYNDFCNPRNKKGTAKETIKGQSRDKEEERKKEKKILLKVCEEHYPDHLDFIDDYISGAKEIPGPIKRHMNEYG